MFFNKVLEIALFFIQLLIATQKIGNSDKYFILFQLAGLILLVSMIGAIVLTLRHRKNVKRQDILSQIYRDPNDALEVVDIKPGQGL